MLLFKSWQSKEILHAIFPQKFYQSPYVHTYHTSRQVPLSSEKKFDLLGKSYVEAMLVDIS